MRYLVILVPIIFTIYSLVDCAATDLGEIRNLPKWAWILIIILVVPFTGLGAIAYWIAGRPKRGGLGRGPIRRVLPPDDDPDFLRRL
jgi:hypothetical protein